MRTKAMRLSGKLQMAKNRKHYCRPVLKSCDFHFGVGHLLEQRLGHGCAWAEGQRCRVPNSHVHSCFKTLWLQEKIIQQGWSYQACQQSVEFVTVLEAVLSSVAMISSLSVALAVAIQAPLGCASLETFLCIRGDI
jgi:hypothetical protein